MATVLINSRQTALMNVLLVEDSPIDAGMIRALLRAPSAMLQCGHVTRLAEALERLNSDEPLDVVLLDLNLDDSCGYETFDRVRHAAPKAAIVVLSGSDDEELAIRTVREGAQDYLVKGTFDGRLLLRAIRYAIERKRSEEALRQSETTVRAIFENSLDGIVIFEGSTGICFEANAAAAALLGVARGELVGQRLCDFCDRGFAEEWEHLNKTSSGRGEFWVYLANGSRRLVDYCFTANILPGQHLAMLRDVTERQNLEEQLRQSQKMEAVGRLAGGVAHDFNNILGIISGYAELLQLQAQHDAERVRAEKIIGATEKASSLTRQLLAFGRKQVMSLKLLDLSDVMEGLGSMVQCVMSDEVQVSVNAGKNLGLVKADQSQLEQVILNLATNAREAMHEGGVLIITIDRYQSLGDVPELTVGNFIRLVVSDNGIGMTPEIQSHIFEPFFTTKKTGSGLGLSTVYGIVKQSGGYVTVQSAPMQGSTFCVYLPLVADSMAAPAAAPVKAKPLWNVQGHETVLLVDNEDDLRNATAEFLEGCGYQVLTAVDGREAVEVSDRYEGNIALVISDIVMPKLNGRGVVEHMRKTRPDTGVLMISGYANDDMERHGISLDPSCFLQKPFTFQALGAKIRRILEKSGS
ncbi:MAG TPA: response regulator [Candidatus Sulfotelmatobacter sp.]|nr:response regulator [Candidatus Sulfotelmatobacter sp.]